MSQNVHFRRIVVRTDLFVGLSKMYRVEKPIHHPNFVYLLTLQVGCLYMLTRLIYNVSQVFLPLYVNKTLKLEKIHIALVPLTVFLSGFVTTTVTKPLSQRIGRKLTYLFGELILIGTLP